MAIPRIETLWGRPISNRQAKERAAAKVAKRLQGGDIVGVGSGSSSFLTLVALAKRRDQDGLAFTAIPTSIEMELFCTELLVPTTQLRTAQPAWSFDGADEVDPAGNLIKGRGGAMLREKLLMARSPEVYIVIDPSKRVKRLGQNFPVPVEIHPEALTLVTTALTKFKTVVSIELRQAQGKDGPVITESGNLILDVHFDHIPASTEGKLKQLVGVVETGLFMGYKPTIVVSK